MRTRTVIITSTCPLTEVKYHPTSFGVISILNPPEALGFLDLITAIDQLLPKFVTMLRWHQPHTLAKIVPNQGHISFYEFYVL